MLLFVDQLTNIDFSYLHSERGLVGETWLASIEMVGELDSQGMVCDFGVVKKTLKSWLDATIDHCLLVPANSPCLRRQSSSRQHQINWLGRSGEIRCDSPLSAIAFIPATDITPESVAKWSIQQLKPQFPSSVKSLSLRFFKETIDGPYYHYSHGLKKHLGNCQRIAHGHRSKILIWRNGELSLQDMQGWSERWRDIYVGNTEDLTADDDSGLYRFRYRAQQGEFFLSLPKTCCYLMNGDSTIELIAKHIADTLAVENPGQHFKVKAFEGLAKGAIASSSQANGNV